MVDFISMFTGMSERDIGLLLKTMVQDSINSQLTNTEISDIDNKTPVLITNSKDVELVNDIPIQAAINIEPSTIYLMPEEPDGDKLKLWLKFQNVGELRDWSYQKNKSYSTGGNTMPGLFSKYNEDSMLKYELYSYFNGISHYAHTLDAPTIQILPNITTGNITSFFMRLVPVSLAKVLYAENNALFTKVDDDQLRYGYSVTVDTNGSLHFYIRNNYRQYYLFVKDAYNYILTDPLYQSDSNFRFENYSKRNFLVGFEYLCGLVASELPFHDWFFKYNPTTHAMSVINTSENNLASVFADTSTITTPVPYLSCPIQEGKWTHSGTVQNTIYDNSGNGNNATITNIATGGQWNDDNTLTNYGGDAAGTGANALQIDFGAISTFNTLTEFTIAFWFNPLDTPINPHNYYERLVTKAGQVNSEIWIERRSSLNELEFNISNGSGVYTMVRFPNAFPVANRYHFVVCKWKSGEKLKISVNNSAYIESNTVLTHTISNSANNLRIFNTNKSPNGSMALFRMWNTQISQIKQDELYYQGYHNPLFPKSENIQPVQEEDPDPVFVPFSNVYTLDKMTTPVLADYRRINSLAGNAALVERYNVADGTDTTDPELNPYNIADGVQTGGGPTSFTEIYTCTDPDNNSSSQLVSGNVRTVVELQSGSSLIGKRVTKAIFYMKGVSTPTGTVKCKIWNAAGTEITTLWLNGTINTNLNAASVNTSTHTAYTFQNTDLTPWGANSLAVGWKIGIEYADGSGSDEIQVKRNRSNPKTTEWNNNYDGSWDTSPDDDDLVANLFEGGTGTPVVDPWVIMKTGSYNRVTEAFGSGDVLLGKMIGKITLRLKKSGSPTGTATVVLLSTTTGTVKATYSPSLNVSTGLTTTMADYTFTNYTHGTVVASTDRIGIMWTPSASGEVHVGTNSGNTGGGNAWNGTNSAVFKYISSYTAESANDLAGKIYTGGNNFDSFLRFSTTRTRLAEKAVNTSSGLNNRKITKVVYRAKKVGSPAGIINCYIRDPTDAVKVTFSSVDISTVGTSYGDLVFENYTHNYLINSGTLDGDKVVVEYSGSDVSNYLQLNSNKDILEGSNTIAQTYDSGNYVDQGQRDLAGHMYEGGEPDLNSRTRVAQSIEHQNSRLKAKKITRVKAFLIRTGTASGTCYCNIRNGDDDLIKTLDTVAVSGLSTNVAAPSEITFDDVTNNYPMTVDDKVCIEFSGGDTSNQVGVLVRLVNPNYDGSNSYIRKFDEFDWDDEEPTYDLCAVMDEGGFFFTPDPNSIPDPTPTNIKDLLYCAGNNAKSGFFETFLMEFRIYAKDITLTQADYLYENRYSISAIAPSSILMPFSFRATSLT